jgi:predicted nucleotidyltransferase
MNKALTLPLEQIGQICRRYDVVELSVFGSVLRQDFSAESDVDLLVTFRPGVDLGPWMSRFFALQEELCWLLNRPVDLVPRQDVERSENYIRRQNILRPAEPIFVAR